MSVMQRGAMPRNAYLESLGLDPERVPRHIAIIMDGNGRWAQRRGLPRIEGHRRGAETVRHVSEECDRLGVECLTLYCLSVENWKRPQAEIELLMELLKRFLKDHRSTLVKHETRLRVIGRREGLPPDVLREIDQSVALTEGFRRRTLCLAINYGGRTELVDAARRLAERVARGEMTAQDIDEASISENLYAHDLPEPDLVIRTAGEHRISNFLLWQISYSEIWVSEVCWPEFQATNLHEALRDFSARERRYGGLGTSRSSP